MSFFWSRNRFSPIGIDFGADSLKLLQIVPGEPPQMVAAATEVLPEQLRDDPAARYAVLTVMIKKLLKAGGFKGNRAACSIPSHQTLVQHFQIPRSDQEDFHTLIATHLRERLNMDPARMIIRSVPVTQVVGDGVAKQEVICLAASRETVIQHIECAQRAKLNVVGMHCEPVLILKAFDHLFRRTSDTERTTCFIDIGARTTKVVIAHGQELVFAHTIHAGGDQLTRHVAKAENISFDEARSRRIQEATHDEVASESQVLSTPGRRDQAVNKPLLTAGTRLPRGPGDESHAESATTVAAKPSKTNSASPRNGYQDTLECLIDELQLCLHYHQSLFADRKIEKLVFLGGESRDVKICKAIAKALRIGAQRGDPFARLIRFGQAKPPVGVDGRQPQPGWAVPLGLCLSGKSKI